MDKVTNGDMLRSQALLSRLFFFFVKTFEHLLTVYALI